MSQPPPATRAAAELELQLRRTRPAEAGLGASLPGRAAEGPDQTVSWSEPVELYAWLKTDGEWYGVVRGEDGRMTYVRGAELRPAEV